MNSKKLVPSCAFCLLLMSAPAFSQLPAIAGSDGPGLGSFASLLDAGALTGFSSVGDLEGIGDLSGVAGQDAGLDALVGLEELAGASGMDIPVPDFPYGDALESIGANFGQQEPGTDTVALFLQPISEVGNNTVPLIDALLSADPEGRFYLPLIEYGMPLFDAVTIAPQKALLKPNGVDFFPDILEPSVQSGVPYFFFVINTIYDNGGTDGAALLFTAINDLTGFRLIAKPHDLFRAMPFSFVELTDPELARDLNESVGIGLLGMSNSGAL